MQTKQLAYSVADACRLAGIGKTTLYGAIKRGELTSRKVGRRTLIPAQALADWIENLPAGQNVSSEDQNGAAPDNGGCRE